jgi:hypothetical protein
MTLSPEWILGTIVAILAMILGFAFKMIADLSAKLERVERDYLRRDDANGKISGVEKVLDEARRDIKEISAMLVQVLLALGKKPD